MKNLNDVRFKTLRHILHFDKTATITITTTTYDTTIPHFVHNFLERQQKIL